jgi:glycosyltransferase involved in cell wall biosynthesis
MNENQAPLLSVIIPAYDEAERLPPTLRSVAAWLATQPFRAEVLVVDDGSTDDTSKVVHTLTDEIPELRLVGSRPNRGKGHAVRMGMAVARGELRLFMVADGSVPITELPKLWLCIESGAGVAIGSRRAPGSQSALRQPWYRRLWSRLANRVVRAGLLEGIRDTQCGFKLFSRQAADAIFPLVRTPGWGFDLEVLALARRLGHRIDEVPVAFTDDRRSRLTHPLRDAWRITKEFLRIRRAFRRGDGPLPAGP